MWTKTKNGTEDFEEPKLEAEAEDWFEESLRLAV